MATLLNEPGNLALLTDAATLEEAYGTPTAVAKEPAGSGVVDGRDYLDVTARESSVQAVPHHRATDGLVEMCHACGATQRLTAIAPYARRGDARFCPTCWRRLTAIQVAAVVREVALRGVPFA